MLGDVGGDVDREEPGQDGMLDGGITGLFGTQAGGGKAIQVRRRIEGMGASKSSRRKVYKSRSAISLSSWWIASLS